MNAARPTPLRIASLWLALAVALLSSLMSEGLPRTTAVGSAFNPATTSVALQPGRAQPRALVVQPGRGDDPAGGQGDGIFPLPPAVHTVAQPVATTQAVKPVAAWLPTTQPAGLDGNPRGPPLT